MSELEISSEIFDYSLQAGMALVAIGMAFSKAIRKQVYREQKGNCAECGDHFPKLETHHIIPHSLGGPDTRDNALGLCHEDHIIYDRIALNGQGQSTTSR